MTCNVLYVNLCTTNRAFITTLRIVSYNQKGSVLIGSHTESLEGICHGLVFSHVDEASTQAEMREDEKHFL